ncbi:MAG TPA: hypothetical protein VIL20_24055 [Sandaracinaceae bacterium]
MTEPLVVVSSSATRRECLSVADRLCRAGIPSLVERRSDAFPIGAPRFDVRVPRCFAADAARYLSGWIGEGAYRTPVHPRPAEDEALPTRQRRLAAFFALGLAFGLGHIYAREYVAGLIVGLAQLACLALAAGGVPEALWAFPGLVAFDAWGALRAVDRENGGERREPTAQLATTLPAVALLLAGATAVLPAPPAPERPSASATR